MNGDAPQDAIGQIPNCVLMPNRVLVVLVLAALAAALGLAFVTVAPNRLVTGVAVPLLDLQATVPVGLWLLALLLAAMAILPPTRLTHASVVVVGVEKPLGSRCRNSRRQLARAARMPEVRSGMTRPVR